MPAFIHSHAKTVVTAAIISLIFFMLAREVGKLGPILDSRSAASIAVDTAVYFLFITVIQFALSTGWLILLKLHAVNPGLGRLFHAFFVPNLGKYVPGKILFALGRVELTHRLGATRQTGISCFMLENLYLIIAAMVLSLPALFIFFEVPVLYERTLLLISLIVLIVIAVISNYTAIPLNRLFGKRMTGSFPSPLPLRAHISMLLYYLTLWAIYGAAGCVLTVGLFDLPQTYYLVVSSAFVASWLGGFLAFFTPGGLGVREGLLVVMLVNILEPGEASLVALIARAIWTITELGLGGLFLLFPISKTMRRA